MELIIQHQEKRRSAASPIEIDAIHFPSNPQDLAGGQFNRPGRKTVRGRPRGEGDLGQDRIEIGLPHPGHEDRDEFAEVADEGFRLPTRFGSRREHTLARRGYSGQLGETLACLVRECGVDARLVMDPERPTGTCVVMITHKGEHTMLSDPGANAALSPDDLPRDLFAPGNHMHVSGYPLLSEGARPAALAAIQYSVRAGMTVSVDAASPAPLERIGAEPFLARTKEETWDEIPADRRDSREAIQAAADAYIDNWGDPDLPVPHGTPCARLEGRIYTGARDPEGQTCTMGAFPQPIQKPGYV